MEASGEKKEKLSAGRSIEFSIRTIQNFGQTTFTAHSVVEDLSRFTLILIWSIWGHIRTW